MSFSYDLSTSVGKVRLNVNDRTSPATFSDEEIQSFLDQNGGDVNLATSMLFYTLAASSTGSGGSIRAGEYSEDLSNQAKQYLDMAKAFAEQAVLAPAEGYEENPSTDIGFREFLRKEVLRGHEI